MSHILPRLTKLIVRMAALTVCLLALTYVAMRFQNSENNNPTDSTAQNTTASTVVSTAQPTSNFSEITDQNSVRLAGFETDITPLHEESSTLPPTQKGIQVPSAGETLIDSTIISLKNKKSVAARVRFRVQLSDLDISGNGYYLQSNSHRLNEEPIVQYRWELRTQIAGKTSSFAQIASKNFLWTDRTLPSKQTVTRIDLRRLRRDRSKEFDPINPNYLVEQGTNPVITQPNSLLLQGGLPRLVQTLQDAYDFAPPKLAKLQDVAIYSVSGRKRSAESLPRKNNDAQKVKQIKATEYLPEYVQLDIGQGDLFPYQLTYLNPGASKLEKKQTVLSIQWHDVQLDGSIDERKFDYTPPARVNWSDITDELLAASNKPPEE